MTQIHVQKLDLRTFLCAGQERSGVFEDELRIQRKHPRDFACQDEVRLAMKYSFASRSFSWCNCHRLKAISPLPYEVVKRRIFLFPLRAVVILRCEHLQKFSLDKNVVSERGQHWMPIVLYMLVCTLDQIEVKPIASKKKSQKLHLPCVIKPLPWIHHEYKVEIVNHFSLLIRDC